MLYCADYIQADFAGNSRSKYCIFRDLDKFGTKLHLKWTSYGSKFMTQLLRPRRFSTHFINIKVDGVYQCYITE